MNAITSHPESRSGPSTDQAVDSACIPVASIDAAFALIAAVLVPPAVVGLLVLIGVAVGIAVCVMFASVFAVTTSLDIRWLVRSRRNRNDLRTARE